jgi:hypothetical protein
VRCHLHPIWPPVLPLNLTYILRFLPPLPQFHYHFKPYTEPSFPSLIPSQYSAAANSSAPRLISRQLAPRNSALHFTRLLFYTVEHSLITTLYVPHERKQPIEKA